MESTTCNPVTERHDVPDAASGEPVETDEIISQALEDLEQISAPVRADGVPSGEPGARRRWLVPGSPLWARVRTWARNPGWLAAGASASTVLLVWGSLSLGLIESASRGGLVLVVALVQGWLVYALLASKRGEERSDVQHSSVLAAAQSFGDPPFDQVLREVDRIATFLESVLDRHAFRIRDELRRRSSQLDDLRRDYDAYKRQWTLRAARDCEEEAAKADEGAQSADPCDDGTSHMPGYEKGTSPLSRANLARMERVAAELLEHLKITAQAIALEEGESSGDRPDVPEGADKTLDGSGSPVGPQIESIELLVRQLVELANLRTGSSWSGASNVVLPEILQEVRTELREAARLRGVRISVRVAEDAREAFLDGGLLRRAIRELVGNAVIHAGKGGRVSLSSTVDAVDPSRPAWLRIRVRDSGRGVLKKDRERIFRPWEVGTRLRESLTGCGLGLGLALARSCARRLGGDLTLQTRPGKGSTFTLSVPLLYAESSEG